ncbi:cell division protein FtsZ [Sandaracinobacter sp. RS1-74]|uniref:cell division protein FtsZ n=1 Tax=Sandaracinobacteroides sayramensis TaxID=2913411 RepID=UPI001EDBCB68|nr:cell division protein FtsZ [Sandaracinobacteroides sayramensis]MCG2840469.1 cell division protein FtsZ [Sandaracinobacteroides sayramensis]
MSFDFVTPSLVELKPRISVIGVGGAGGNAVANMINDGLQGVDFVVANTDAQALTLSPATNRIQLGLKITQGLGAGARPEIGAAAAEEALGDIDQVLDGVHMCFITAGMGGGTGTGAAPVVARAARERGVLTVGVVTKPFAFEGLKRMRSAEEGIAELQRHVDTLIVIPNQNLFLIANQQTTFKQAFAMADQVLNQGVRGITDLMMLPGLINLDFADVRTVMSEMGKAMMGTGEAEGDRRAIEAAEKAISNPLLDEVSLRGAKAVIINITGGDDLGLMEVEEAAQHIREMVDPDANIIVGSAFNDGLNGKMRVSVVATGIESQQATLPGVQPARQTSGSMFGGRTSPIPAAAPGVGEIAPTEPTPPFGGGGGGGGFRPQTSPASGPMAAGVFGTAGATFRPAASAAPVPVAEAPAEPQADDAGLSDEDILELEEPMAPVAEAARPPAAVEPEPVVAELPLAMPQRLELPEAEQRAVEAETYAAAPQPERRQTLFERMMDLARKPKAEEAPIETLAPEPEADSEDETRIPPFMRRQRN